MTETTTNFELYKKYRPRVWDDLIGQQKVARGLKSAATTGKVPTAYLFSGPRGCGKTSAALLLAKTLNCENLTKNGDPCNECRVCEGVDSGSLMGFNYVSMANKGGVDDVRAMMRDARLTQPIKKQVWILDEVHNLSKAAFDSLLIPLEDKSMSALFIMCSTEIEKIPSTILSRVQQRKFQLVDSKEMLDHLKTIVEAEGIETDDEVLQSAVRDGRGSVRDTLTALDTILETGEFSSTYGGRILEAISSRSLVETYKVIAEANADSVDFRDFAEQLFEDLRDLLLISSGVQRDLVGIPPIKDEEKVLKGLCGPKGIMVILNEVGDGITNMSIGMDSRIVFEVSLLKGLSTLNRMVKAAQASKQA